MSYSSVRPVGSFFFALLLVFSLPIIYLISVLSAPYRRLGVILLSLVGHALWLLRCGGCAGYDTALLDNKICRRNRLLYCRGMNRLGRRWPINSLCRRWLLCCGKTCLIFRFGDGGLVYEPHCHQPRIRTRGIAKNKKTRAATLARRFCCCCLSRRHADGAE